MVRIRWKDPIPPRDWKRWGLAYAAHFTTGLLSGAGLVLTALGAPAVIAATLAVTAAVCARQGLEWGRRNDTPGRDVGDHLIGLALMVSAAVVIAAVKLVQSA